MNYLLGLFFAVLVSAVPVLADDNWDTHQKAAVDAYGNGNLARAEQELNEAIDLARKAGKTSNVISMQANLGSIYRAQKRYTEAIKILEQSVVDMKKEHESDPVPLVSSLNNIGECYRAAGQTEKGLPALLEAKSLVPKDNFLYPIVLQNLGMSYAQLSKDKEAEDTFKEAISLTRNAAPDSAVEGMLSLSLLYMKQGRRDEIIPVLDEAISITAKNGESDPRAQKLKSMRELAQDPKKFQWSSLMEQGYVANRAENYGSAVTLYEKALQEVEQFGPDSADMGVTLITLGSAYMFVGDKVKGQTTLNRALALYKSKFPDRQKELAIIERMLAVSQSAK